MSDYLFVVIYFVYLQGIFNYQTKFYTNIFNKTKKGL